MDSDQDLLAEGFPHSEIRGSTIARISPRLIAACHVLHRLLAPRHPPNALFSLHHTLTARAQGQVAPHASCSSCVISRNTLPRREVPRTLIRNHIHNTPDPIHNLKEQSPTTPGANALLGEQAPGPSGNPLVFLCLLQSGASPAHQQPPMETTGFEPVTLCLQSRCSTN